MMVVYQHTYRLLTGHDARGWEWGGAGVDIFFVISGFIMVYTTQGGRKPIDFWRNRLQRIVPLYWLMTFAIFVVALVIPSVLGATRASPTALLQSLLFIPYVKGNGAVAPMLPMGWSLNLEMLFYALFGACLYFGKWSVAACALVLCMLVSLHPIATNPVWAFVTQPLMLGFVAGMLIAKFKPVIPVWAAIAILPFCFASFLVHVMYFPTVDHGVARLLPSALIVLAFISFEEHGMVVKSRLPLLLGNASYSIYLVHPFITQPFVIFSHKGGGLGVVFWALAMSCSALAGIALYLAVEAPITDYLKRHRGTRRLGLSAVTS